MMEVWYREKDMVIINYYNPCRRLKLDRMLEVQGQDLLLPSGHPQYVSKPTESPCLNFFGDVAACDLIQVLV